MYRGAGTAQVDVLGAPERMTGGVAVATALLKRVDGKTLDEQMKKYDITDTEIDAEADRIYHSSTGQKVLYPDG